MKLGKYADAKANNDKVMEMCDNLRGAFGDDYAIVASKFYMQQANIAFVFGNLE